MSLLGFKARSHPQQTRSLTGAPGLFELEPDAFDQVDDIDDRGTTFADFMPLLQRFGFTVDVAAAEHNAKVERFYDLGTNGLTQPWDGERVWCNPPFSNIRPWVEKAWSEWDMWARHVLGPDRIVMLLPANRTEQGWWQELVEPHLRGRRDDFKVEFLPGRLRFLRKGQSVIGPNEWPPFGCCLLIWGEL